MGVTFTSAYRALAHGALNWDTQLGADWLALEGFLDKTSMDRTDTTAGAWSADLNTATLPGSYRINGGTIPNFPSGAYAFGTLIVSSTINSGVVQLYVSDSGPGVHIREKFASTWTAWQQLNNPAVQTGVGTGGTGFTNNRFNLRRQGNVVTLDFSATRTGGTITGTTTGNITNVALGTVGTWVPSMLWAPVASGPGGPTCSFAVNSSGTLYLCAMPPSYNLTNTQEITAGGSWITDAA